MRVRRVVTAVLVVLLAAPLAPEAQSPRRVPRVGIVAATSPALARNHVDAFRKGLPEPGWVDASRPTTSWPTGGGGR